MLAIQTNMQEHITTHLEQQQITTTTAGDKSINNVYEQILTKTITEDLQVNKIRVFM